jgi:DnaJ domain
LSPNMAQPDFYEIFGLPSSASQKEIRAAHRDLVKRYHPDIYSTSGDKARATEKLQAINEAYAVLSNPERRKEYDARRVERPRRAQPSAPERSAHVGRARSAPHPQAPPGPVRAHKKFQWKKRFFTFPWLAGTVAGVTLFVVAAYAFYREPRYLPVWVLLQKTDVEPAASGHLAGATGWERLGGFGFKAECARELKARVKLDEEQGGHAVFDEVGGTVAITVLLIENDSAQKAKELVAGQGSVAKRVRQYECRAVQMRQPDSWLRRKLRETGLVR